MLFCDWFRNIVLDISRYYNFLHFLFMKVIKVIKHRVKTMPLLHQARTIHISCMKIWANSRNNPEVFHLTPQPISLRMLVFLCPPHPRLFIILSTKVMTKFSRIILNMATIHLFVIKNHIHSLLRIINNISNKDHKCDNTCNKERQIGKEVSITTSNHSKVVDLEFSSQTFLKVGKIFFVRTFHNLKQ